MLVPGSSRHSPGRRSLNLLRTGTAAPPESAPLGTPVSNAAATRKATSPPEERSFPNRPRGSNSRLPRRHRWDVGHDVTELAGPGAVDGVDPVDHDVCRGAEYGANGDSDVLVAMRRESRIGR